MPEAIEEELFIPALNLIADRNVTLHMVERATASETSVRSVRLEDVFARLVYAKIPGTRANADELFGETQQAATWALVYDRYAPFVDLFADGDRDHVAAFVPLHIRIPEGLAAIVRELSESKENTHV